MGHSFIRGVVFVTIFYLSITYNLSDQLHWVAFLLHSLSMFFACLEGKGEVWRGFMLIIPVSVFSSGFKWVPRDVEIRRVQEQASEPIRLKKTSAPMRRLIKALAKKTPEAFIMPVKAGPTTVLQYTYVHSLETHCTTLLFNWD